MSATGISLSAAGFTDEQHLGRWRYDDPWAGHTLTEGAARAQAHYARMMYEAAMRGRLDQFIAETKGKTQ